ncbi:MAG: RNA polymerase sigma factor [Defluviitaleaceae bacterium]|nr:RNA polymerase sigma factor [Defluviitaleaceae bacterium]
MIKFLLARGKDNSTFEEVYERRAEMVYRVCFSYLKNAADAEDITSQVFEKLLKHAPALKSEEHEKAWLLRTAINMCKNHLKSWRRKTVNIDDYESLEYADAFPNKDLIKTVFELPERYKDVIYLYYYEGYSTAEVAEILSKPQSTIRSHMREARILLKGVLEDEER